MNTNTMKKTMFMGLAITALAAGCCTSCNAIEECFGKGENTSAANCGKCGGTSCTRSCTASEGELTIPACNLPDGALRERAAFLKNDVFAKAVRIDSLPNGYTFHFAQPDGFHWRLEDLAAFERKCCTTIQWTVDHGQGGQRLTATSDVAVADLRNGLRAMGLLPQ